MAKQAERQTQTYRETGRQKTMAYRGRPKRVCMAIVSFSLDTTTSRLGWPLFTKL